MMIRKAKRQDLNTLAMLGIRLWPDNSAADLTEEFARIMESSHGAFFLSFAGNEAVGFAQCQLRHDYVEGTSCSPVGYLEGIYVSPEYRRQGRAGELLSACQDWAKEKGCREFASDCELENEQSLHFHLCHGFEEANRIICFTRKL